MNQSVFQRVYTYLTYPRDSTITTNTGFVNIDNGSLGGTHRVCLILKDNKSFYCDSFAEQPDEILLKQLPKPKIYQSFKIQQMNSRFCRYNCLNFFYLIGRLEYYDAILKMYFG